MAIPEAAGTLAGTRIIVTRARKQAAALAEQLAGLGAEVVSMPLIEIAPPANCEPLDRAIDQIESFDWLIAASVNAVDYFLRRFDQLKQDRRLLDGLLIAAVGPKTRERIEDEGLPVVLVPDNYTAESVVAGFLNHYPDPEELNGLRVLIPASNITRDVIRPALAARGVKVELVETYRTLPPQLSRDEALECLDPSSGGYLIFASPSAVDHLAGVLGLEDLGLALEGLQIVCIGPTTAQAARRCGLVAALMPAEYRVEALIKLFVEGKRSH